MANPPPVLTLRVEKGPREGRFLQHRAGAVLRVGRVVKGNDLALGDAGASQRHLDIALLPPPASRWVATDLGSSNGTLLNDAPLVPTVPSPLSHGDRIKIGETTVLAVSISADAGPEPIATRRSTRHAVAADVEEEKKAPAVRRGRPRKAPAAADHPEVVMGKAEVATRRGGRKKAAAAVVPPEEEKEEAAPVTRRGGRKKAVERPEAEERDEEEEVQPGGRSKASVMASLPPQPETTRWKRAASRRAEASGTEQDKGECEQTRSGRAGTNNSSADRDKKEKESGREEGNNIGQELRERMTPESKPDGFGEAGDDGIRELSGGRGEGVGKNVSKCTGGCSLENMTLREWFVQIEKYILAKNHEAAEKAIAEVKEKHRRFDEYIKTLM